MVDCRHPHATAWAALRRSLAAGLVLAFPSLVNAAQMASTESPSPGGVGQIVEIGLVVLLVTVGFSALCLLCQVMRPALVRSAAIIAGRSPIRSLIYGVLMTIIVVLQLSLSKALPGFLGGILSLLFAVPYIGFLVLGATAVAHALGEKLLTNAGSPRQTSSVWAVLCGSALLGAVNLVPFLGQFVAIVGLSIGLGAMARHILGRKRTQTSTE